MGQVTPDSARRGECRVKGVLLCLDMAFVQRSALAKEPKKKPGTKNPESHAGHVVYNGTIAAKYKEHKEENTKIEVEHSS